MKSIVVRQFRIRCDSDGISSITFYGDGEQKAAVEFKTIALMGLAIEIGKAAGQSPVPLTQRATTSGRKPLTGPPVPALEDTSKGAPPSSVFGVAISADFETISAWFNLIPKEGEPGSRITIELPIADAERFVSDLSKAIALAKTKPRPPTKH